MRHISAVIAFLLAASSAAYTQDHRATVRGVVLDPSFQGLANVEVRVTREETSDTRRVRTDNRGLFTVPELPAGIYRVDVEQTGYGPFVARTELAIGQEFWLRVPLQVGAVVQAVDVTAPFIPVDYDTPALHTFISERQITGLPLDGRNFLELALLAPGTVPPPQGSASTGRGDFALSINGAREDFNGFLLDGVYNVDPKLNTPSVRPPVDAIRQFQVLTSTYDASFGRNAGGQINVITRSGANRLSGSAYEFLRNGTFDSRNYFAPENEDAPRYTRHQFGGSAGGPLVRNRTFFFADYERTHLREGVTRITNVPTLAERTGDFSRSLFNRPINFLTGQPFDGGVIPQPFQSPIGREIAALYPAPNRDTPFANYVSSPTRRDDVDQVDLRIDQSIAAGGRLTGRYSLSDRRLFDPFAGPGFPWFRGSAPMFRAAGRISRSRSRMRPLPAFVNDVRFGYNRVSIGVFAENTATSNHRSASTLSTTPRDAGLSLSFPLPAIRRSATNTPRRRRVRRIRSRYRTPPRSRADVTSSRLAGEWYGVRQSAYRDVQSRGFLNFVNQGYTGNALADLLLGLPVLTGGARLDNPQNLRARNWSLFAQDDWRPRGIAHYLGRTAVRLRSPRLWMRTIARICTMPRPVNSCRWAANDAARWLRAGPQQPCAPRRLRVGHRWRNASM